MILKRIKTDIGTMIGENCYIIQDDETKETMIIDPGNFTKELEDMLEALDIKLKYIVLTHCHADHITGAEQIKQKYGGKILVHIEDAKGLTDPNVNLCYYIGLDDVRVHADSRLNDGDLLHIKDLEFEVIHTPGHTQGSICLYCEKEGLLFSGDTLFRGTWGRTDLPTSSFENIINSITNKLMILPEETIVYPGHGKSTIIQEEKIIYLEMKQKEWE